MSMPTEVSALRTFLVKKHSLATTDEDKSEADTAMEGFYILHGSLGRAMALISFLPEDVLATAMEKLEEKEKELVGTAH